ncbi:hypothetical protein ACIA5C_00585 [Actinoplanes sp. NPDC051343]|jgi:hypothetical protein|uniref:hypothetical protein n=1 Tax=Actinoplanes sp. NPDC051343 TaxID=3363906 RepID=UPI00378D0706
MMIVATDVLLGALAGPLLLAGVVKLRSDPRSLGWPVRRGVLAAPAGPRLVGGGELAVAAVLVAAPGPLAAGAGVLAYAALTIAARALYGRRCACFGTSRLAAVSRTHVALNALGAAAAAGTFLLPGGPSGAPPLRAAAAAAALAVTAAAMRRGTPAADPPAAACSERVTEVRLFTSPGCPSCRSLKSLVDAMEPARRERVVTTELGSGEAPPPPLTAGTAVPAAYAVGVTGLPVCAPAVGIGAVKALIDTITVGSRVRDAG